MRHFALLALLACAKPVTVEVPYADASSEGRVKPLRMMEDGSGVVVYATAPERIFVKNPSIATVVRFDGEQRFHLFGEAVGETVLVADLGEMRHQLPVEVVSSDDIEPEIELVVGQQASLPVELPAQRVVVGDPGVVSFRLISDGRTVQIEGVRPGRSHVVISSGPDAPPTFAWVVVQ